MSINCCQFFVSGDFSEVSPFQGDQYTSNGIWLRKSHNSAKRYTLYPLYIIDHTFQTHPQTLWRIWMNLPNKKTLKKQKVFTESVRKHPVFPRNFPQTRVGVHVTFCPTEKLSRQHRASSSDFFAPHNENTRPGGCEDSKSHP